MKRRHFFSTIGLGAFLASSIGIASASDTVKNTNKKASAGRIDQRLNELGIVVPEATAPMAVYAPYRVTGNLVYIAGQGPAHTPENPGIGRVGHDLTTRQGYMAARSTGLNILAQLKAACGGDLDRVTQCIQIHGVVRCTEDFEDSPKVINGASELFRDIFGQSGLAARAAMGAYALPAGIACEIISIWEIDI